MGNTGQQSINLSLSEVRAYGLPNLIQRDDVTVTIDAPSIPGDPAKYLSAGLVIKDEHRACDSVMKPFINLTGDRADFASYRVTEANYVSG